jgi:hypothetical protein
MSELNYPRWYAVMAEAFAVSEESIAILAGALLRGKGDIARFNIPELGGQGIWKKGQGAVIGNGFDDNLNQQATELCEAIQEALYSEANRSTLEVQGVTDTSDMMPVSIQPDGKEVSWWPKAFGKADIQGETDTLRYAYFSEHHRLIVQTNQRTRFFDTTGFHIHSIGSVGGADFMNAIVKTDVGEFALSRLKEIV